MNTRTPLQPSNTPAVLSLAFTPSRRRFIAGLSTGLRIFRSENCLTTWPPTSPAHLPGGAQPTLPSSFPTDGGIAIAEALDDRHVAFVSGRRMGRGSGNVVVFWDCVAEKEVGRLDFKEAVLGVRVDERWMVVVLRERVVLLQYQILTIPQRGDDDGSDGEKTEHGGEEEEEVLKGPNKVHSLHRTALNPSALACLRNDLLVLPAQSTGQVQLITLLRNSYGKSGTKRVLRAHNTSIAYIALSPSGTLLATASEQGTLIRVFSTKTLDQIAEFRRGVDKAVIFGLAFSEGERWLAATSDKGTIHIFDLRPPPPASAEPTSPSSRHPGGGIAGQQHRKSSSHPQTQPHSRIPPSVMSGRSSPSTATTTQHGYAQGSIQEYYGLRPPPSSASPTATGAAISVAKSFKSSSFAPRFLKDTRSIASLPFYTGDDPPHWQGGTSHSWTTAPGGTRKRIRNPIAALPNDTTGRPRKGVVAFAPARGSPGDFTTMSKEEDEGVGPVGLYVIGGGSDARWEYFELVYDGEGGRWVLINRGFRRYLTRQFVD